MYGDDPPVDIRIFEIGNQVSGQLEFGPSEFVLAAAFTKCYAPRHCLALQVGSPKKAACPGFSGKVRFTAHA